MASTTKLTPNELRTLQRIADGETLWGFYWTGGKPDFFVGADFNHADRLTSEVNVLMLADCVNGKHEVTEWGRKYLEWIGIRDESYKLWQEEETRISEHHRSEPTDRNSGEWSHWWAVRRFMQEESAFRMGWYYKAVGIVGEVQK